MATAKPIPATNSAVYRQDSTGNSSGTKTSSNGITADMQNCCLNSASPYVRSHADNPIAWQVWGPEAFALAKKLNRLIFLSIGYAACHWCHVMERESFENEEIATMLNNSFIPVLVDREERCDVDEVYLNYVQASAGTGGWPLTVFLTPDLAPVYGCTYLTGPSSNTPGIDGSQNFMTTLVKIRDVWREQEERCLQSANEVIEQLHQFTADGKQVSADEEPEELELDLIEETWQSILAKYDALNGGFGSSPKFLHPANLNYFLRVCAGPAEVRDVVGHEEIKSSLVILLDTLRKMANGGVYDQIGSGFHRYSVTPDWSLPHFEKTLSDQAQMLCIYLDAYLVTKDVNLLSVAVDIGDYLTAGALAAPDGAYYTAEDSESLPLADDTDKREGAYYVWTRKEFNTVLGEREGEIAAKYYNVTSHGNIAAQYDAHDDFITQNVLRIVSTPAQLASDFGLREEDVLEILADCKEKLLVYRETERPRPLIDESIITEYNGHAIGALARLAGVMDSLEPERAAAYRTSAQRAAKFLYDNVYSKTSAKVLRMWSAAGQEARIKSVDGFADDYAALIWGLLHLYEATFDDSYLEWADNLQKTQLALFWDSIHGGFFSTEPSSELIIRLKDGMDASEPSVNGLSASNLLRLASFLADSELVKRSQLTVRAFATEILQHPYLYVTFLDVIVAMRVGLVNLVLLSGDDNQTSAETIKRREKALKYTVPADSRTVTGVSLKRKEQAGGPTWLESRNPLVKKLVETGKAGVFKMTVGGENGSQQMQAVMSSSLSSSGGFDSQRGGVGSSSLEMHEVREAVEGL